MFAQSFFVSIQDGIFHFHFWKSWKLPYSWEKNPKPKNQQKNPLPYSAVTEFELCSPPWEQMHEEGESAHSKWQALEKKGSLKWEEQNRPLSAGWSGEQGAT